MAAVTSQATNSQDNPLVGFGPNEWIVDDMYQRYLADPTSVDPAWHDFFADYTPVATGEPASTKPAAAAAPAVASPPASPPPAPPPPATAPDQAPAPRTPPAAPTR